MKLCSSNIYRVWCEAHQLDLALRSSLNLTNSSRNLFMISLYFWFHVSEGKQIWWRRRMKSAHWWAQLGSCHKGKFADESCYRAHIKKCVDARNPREAPMQAGEYFEMSLKKSRMSSKVSSSRCKNKNGKLYWQNRISEFITAYRKFFHRRRILHLKTKDWMLFLRLRPYKMNCVVNGNVWSKKWLC